MGGLVQRSSSRALSSAIKSANRLVFRLTWLTLLVIVLVHLTVVYLLSDHLARREKGHFPAADDGGEPGMVAMAQPPAVEYGSEKKMTGMGRRKSRERKEDEGRNASIADRFFFSQSTTACRQGHIQGYDGFCDPASSCLRQLRRSGGPQSDDAPRPDSLPAATRRKIQSMTGNLDPVHYSIVPLLADLQWSSGVYGSMGAIGVNTGKFTVVLAHNVNPEAGEGFFVSDNFDVPPPMPGLPVGPTKYQVFSVYMRETGFGEDFSGLRRLHVHRGEPPETRLD